MWYFYIKQRNMIFFPGAKINIGLRITGKRSDGFHDIETVFYPVGLSDALEYVVAEPQLDKDILHVTGIETGSTPEENLVMKTVQKLRKEKPFPFLKIHLHKAIPVGAGLGGGSSDSACMLKVLNRHFGLGVDDRKIKSLALELGSDCPFFIDCVPSLATGRGEVLTPLKTVLSGYYLAIINPGVSINTREAYQHCIPALTETSLSQLIEYPVREWKGLLTNDFEDYAIRKFPVIGAFKEELYKSNAIYSLMSGSGSSVYGIFSEKPRLPQKLKDYLIWEGVL
jgi:4-diphosphocytidyl-2-C-methyl-D-erythritol kinase